MLHIRTVSIKSGARSVQVIRYDNRRRVIVKHIGTGHNKEEIESLIAVAEAWVKDYIRQLELFPATKGADILLLNHTEYLGFYYTFLYDVINKLQQKLGYISLKAPLVNDLVTMRILEPCSKLRSIELMETYFGIKHRRQHYYESALKWLNLKEEIEKLTVRFAEKEFEFDYSLLFYDVTTLYFETFEPDDLRKMGFSKDNKSQQPQILVALMVTREGFPVAYDIFPGNTFEGHTIIPSIQSFIKKHEVKHFTVVADAAMISAANIQALKQANIHYIVGARLGNVPGSTLACIDKYLVRQNGCTTRMNTENGSLICSYSEQRFKKDQYEMEKQLETAQALLDQPAKIKKAKFIVTKEEKIALNNELIEKTKKLLGVKGYYTDLPEAIADNNMIIERYHELYKIEQAFRVAKSDMQTRPIFHFKEEPIKLHLMICFMALAVAKYIEIKTEVSIRSFTTNCKKVTTARILNHLTKKEIRMQAKIPEKLSALIEKLNSSH
jgi:transposase